MESCIFCKIVAKQIPAKVVLETTDVLAFYDINPAERTHILIIPKTHCKNMKDVDTKSGLPAAMFEAVKSLSVRLDGNRSFKIAVNNEASAGQVVFHLHWHFISKDVLLD